MMQDKRETESRLSASLSMNSPLTMYNESGEISANKESANPDFLFYDKEAAKIMAESRGGFNIGSIKEGCDSQ